MPQLTMPYPRMQTDHVDAVEALLQRLGWTRQGRSPSGARWHLPGTTQHCSVNWYTTCFYTITTPPGVSNERVTRREKQLPTGNIPGIAAHLDALAYTLRHDTEE